MRIVSTADMLPLEQPSVVCLGYFDGVHKAHQALLSAARDMAREKGLLMCVHTFDRSPAQAMHPEKQLALLTTEPEKEALLAAHGCQVLAISEFNDAMRHMPGKNFFEDILLGLLRANAIVAGYDHRFGFKGDTDVAQLRELCEQHGVSLRVVEQVTLDTGEVISSTAVRRALSEGNIPLAEAMLGRKIGQDMIFRCGMRQER